MSFRQFFLTTVLIMPQLAVAIDLESEDLFFDVREVTLSMSDQVTDGCLPAPQSIASQMASALRRNAFVLVDPENAPASTPEVEVAAFGYAIDDECMVSFTVVLARTITAQTPYLETTASMRVSLPIYTSLLNGDRQGMQRQIEVEADQAGDDFRAAVNTAQNSVEQNWPELWKAFTAAGED